MRRSQPGINCTCGSLSNQRPWRLRYWRCVALVVARWFIDPWRRRLSERDAPSLQPRSSHNSAPKAKAAIQNKWNSLGASILLISFTDSPGVPIASDWAPMARSDWPGLEGQGRAGRSSDPPGFVRPVGVQHGPLVNATGETETVLSGEEGISWRKNLAFP